MNNKTSALKCKWTAYRIIKYDYIDLVCVYEYEQDKIYANECTLKIMLVTYCNFLSQRMSTLFNIYSNYESDRN